MTRELDVRSVPVQKRFCVALALFVVGSLFVLAGTFLGSEPPIVWTGAGAITVLALAALAVRCFRSTNA